MRLTQEAEHLTPVRIVCLTARRKATDRCASIGHCAGGHAGISHREHREKRKENWRIRGAAAAAVKFFLSSVFSVAKNGASTGLTQPAEHGQGRPASDDAEIPAAAKVPAVAPDQGRRINISAAFLMRRVVGFVDQPSLWPTQDSPVRPAALTRRRRPPSR